MLRFINETDLHYPQGDTFIMAISSDDEFTDGSMLDLVISKNDKAEELIKKTFYLADNSFTVELSTADKKKLVIGEEYVYKLVLRGVDGTVFTQKSGFLKVEWGA